MKKGRIYFLSLPISRYIGLSSAVQVNSSLVRQAQLGASYRVPCLSSWAGSPHRAKLNQQPVPSVARSAEPERLAGEQRS